MSKYVFDSVRWLRNWSARKRFLLADGRDPFALVADDVARLKAELAALVEAVAWERECDYLWEFGLVLSNIANDELLWSMKSARAEVDRLLNDDADCQGEG